MLTVRLVNPLECHIDRKWAKVVKPAISYPAQFWRQTFRGRERIDYEKSCWLYKGKEYFSFYRGHLPRVVSHLKKTHTLFKIVKQDELTPLIDYKWPPDLGSYDERDYQIDILKTAVQGMRGIIVAPTGVGKTVMQLGVLSCFRDHEVLILAHTIDIVNQTAEKLKAEGYDVEVLGGGVSFSGCFSCPVVVSTIQTFAKVPQEHRAFPIVIVDETHHVSKFDGNYGKVLSSMLSPVRLGFTATMYEEKKEQYFAATGLLGPVLRKMTIHEAAKKEILAKPKIKFIRVRKSDRIRRLRKYDDVMLEGVVLNESRNEAIAQRAVSEYNNGEVVLIFVNYIEHGRQLQLEFENYGLTVPFVQGSMNTKNRIETKQALEKKKIRMAIATVTWKEGVDIPSLTVVINAAGGKSEIAVMQSIGRGLRRKGKKTEVTIYDVFDQSHPFLIDHFGERLAIYMENNWI